MPRPLTAVAVNNAKSEGGKRREIADGAAPGLRLVIQPSGSKSWAFRYERPGGAGAKVTLGPAAGVGALSLADARQRVGELRRGMTAGADPAEGAKTRRAEALRAAEAAREAVAAEAKRDETRVALVLDRYLDRHVAKLKSAHEVRRLFNREVRPAWHALVIADIKKRDVAALIDDIAARGAGTMANRVLAHVRAWLGWCVSQGIIETSPADGLRPPSREIVRDRVLDDREMAAVLAAANAQAWPWREFVAVLAFTGQRRDEVAGMRWDEVDLEAAEPAWIIPAARTKNARLHVVPLAPQVVGVLRAIPRTKGSSFVFTTTGTTAISGFSRAKATLDAAVASGGATLPPWRFHDLRRSTASGMARLGVSIAAVEKTLNHVSGTFGGIVGVYQRHDFLAEKRDALARWADHLSRLSEAQ